MRREAADRLPGTRRRSFRSLPPTPVIDPWTACGVSLVELARMAQKVVS
jgi:hypothetical protein